MWLRRCLKALGAGALWGCCKLFSEGFSYVAVSGDGAVAERDGLVGGGRVFLPDKERRRDKKALGDWWGEQDSTLSIQVLRTLSAIMDVISLLRRVCWGRGGSFTQSVPLTNEGAGCVREVWDVVFNVATGDVQFARGGEDAAEGGFPLRAGCGRGGAAKARSVESVKAIQSTFLKLEKDFRGAGVGGLLRTTPRWKCQWACGPSLVWSRGTNLRLLRGEP